MNSYKYEEISNYFNDFINEQSNEWIEDNLDDLHHQAFNTDYFLIGIYKCEQWLSDNAFDCIRTVKDFENDNFGECTTDLSNPEKVVNMYAYIIGEDIVQKFIVSRLTDPEHAFNIDYFISSFSHSNP